MPHLPGVMLSMANKPPTPATSESINPNFVSLDCSWRVSTISLKAEVVSGTGWGVGGVKPTPSLAVSGMEAFSVGDVTPIELPLLSEGTDVVSFCSLRGP